VLAGQLGSGQAGEALAALCQIYWKPVFEFVRRQGHNREAAKDLTQEFFARLVQKNWLGEVDREKGRFRSFLLTCLRHFLANEWEKAHTSKRGGGRQVLSLDEPWLQGRPDWEPSDSSSPEKVFDRRWALTLLEQATAQLQQEYARAGKTPLFEALEDFLSGSKNAVASYAEVARRFGMTEAAVRQAAYRMRGRLGDLVRWQVSQTVANPAEIEDELAQLMAALSG
jgi:RNA polymerase sigma-70 factor (ECF subfamily)